jgi:hypothetical protein
MLLAAGLASALAACNDVSVEQTPNTGQTLCFADYKACVDPILQAAINGRNGVTTCAASGCHDINTGSGGGFKIFPNPGDDTRLLSNFNTAKAFANLNSPTGSKLLLEPLNGISAISGTHTGGDIFASTTDPCYKAIRAWISNRVEDEAGAGCGVCSAPEPGQCGF